MLVGKPRRLLKCSGVCGVKWMEATLEWGSEDCHWQNIDGAGLAPNTYRPKSSWVHLTILHMVAMVAG